jgi:UrcA family protein
MRNPRLVIFSAAIVITAAELALLTSPAHGRSPIVVSAPAAVVVRHVSYADLNLASAVGARALTHRVAYAVSDLCNEATGGPDGSLTANLELGHCARGAWRQARPQMLAAEARARRSSPFDSSAATAAAIMMTYPE